MVLKLYGFPLSTYTQKVQILLEETHTPYEFVIVDIRTGAHKAPEYLALNPLGAVPAMDDDGFVLYQSRAICRYIAAKVGTPLIPTGDIKAEARYEQAVQIEASEYDGDVQKLVFQRVFTPMFGGTPDEALVQQLAARLEGKIRVYEQILAKQKYLAGDNLTMADLYHLPFGVYLAPQGFKWFEDKEKYPNLARWWADISARPSWQKVKQGSAL